jgi:hypothetical protein
MKKMLFFLSVVGCLLFGASAYAQEPLEQVVIKKEVFKYFHGETTGFVATELSKGIKSYNFHYDAKTLEKMIDVINKRLVKKIGVCIYEDHTILVKPMKASCDSQMGEEGDTVLPVITKIA